VQAAGDTEPSFVARFLEEGVDEELIKAAAASLYSGARGCPSWRMCMLTMDCRRRRDGGSP
jgi:hypothetical protein